MPETIRPYSLLNHAQVTEHVKSFGDRFLFHPSQIRPVLNTLSPLNMTKPVVSFVLLTNVYQGLDPDISKNIFDEDDLVEYVRETYKSVTGLTISSLVVFMRQHLRGERGPVTCEEEGNRGWKEVISLGLETEIFQLGNDQDTLTLDPVVRKLFFPED